LRTTPDQLKSALEKAGFVAERTTPVPEELTLVSGMPTKTKAYQRGEFMFQDPASMLAAHLVEPHTQANVFRRLRRARREIDASRSAQRG
jgi:16S rRNA C967 or C1407 C5-methylase (RsmB/RsmF family)